MVEPYDPCPCGSGKKYKFCCKQRKAEREQMNQGPSLRVLANDDAFDPAAFEGLIGGDLEEAERFNNRGNRLFQQGAYKDALKWFEKARDAAPFYPPASNNLALCHYALGDLEEAIRVQQECLNECLPLNPFGSASLSVFLLVAGDEQASRDALDEALDSDMLNSDACVKVCETLARFKRHKDIIELTGEHAAIYSNDPGLHFYAGVAAANLGMKDEALASLRRVHVGYYKARMAQRYIDWLKADSPPLSVMGDWPYLLSQEICPLKIMEAQIQKDEAAWSASLIALHLCEAMLNESLDDIEKMLPYMRICKHPETDRMLGHIIKGKVGPDALRLHALTLLHERGVIKRNEPVTLFMNGAYRETIYQGAQLNPAHRFGPELPPHLQQRYEKAVRAAHEKFVVWKELGEEFRQIAVAAPDFYPARFNQATCLLHQGQHKKAEALLKPIVADHPEYLFAAGALVQLYLRTGRAKKAGELIQTIEIPDETHPSAMAQWMVAQTLYAEEMDDMDTAMRCIESAKNIDPNSPLILDLYQRLRGGSAPHR